jgi:hypothetical protein
VRRSRTDAAIDAGITHGAQLSVEEPTMPDPTTVAKLLAAWCALSLLVGIAWAVAARRLRGA